MSDRIKGISISFTRDMSEEETQKIVDLVHCIKGVESVKRYPTDANTFMDRSRIKCELRDKIMKILE